ncbi:hypothetical protein DFH07DRAFT_16889 [Mycena maculata]|uniref:Uncharacterized protein n=1 Tax=Mycena maculata TaxID=230809 RepID=A0AAD7N5M1_9AGAR|nr:hypothetical protein DFH07DRAFT_16889 [Mycena maculata]
MLCVLYLRRHAALLLYSLLLLYLTHCIINPPVTILINVLFVLKCENCQGKRKTQRKLDYWKEYVIWNVDSCGTVNASVVRNAHPQKSEQVSIRRSPRAYFRMQDRMIKQAQAGPRPAQAMYCQANLPQSVTSVLRI